jgi:hypothetical protein
MRVINFDKGSKRRLQGIRWNRIEIIWAALLSLIMIATCILAGLWFASLDSDEPTIPSLEIKR